jgi:hypothetical protein
MSIYKDYKERDECKHCHKRNFRHTVVCPFEPENMAHSLDALEAELAASKAQVVKLWECPNCCFRFDAAHSLAGTDGEYSCPVCDEEKTNKQLAASKAQSAQLAAALEMCRPYISISLLSDDIKQIDTALAAWQQDNK